MNSEIDKDTKEYKLVCHMCGSRVTVEKQGIRLLYTCPECGLLHFVDYQEQGDAKPTEFTTLA